MGVMLGNAEQQRAAGTPPRPLGVSRLTNQKTNCWDQTGQTRVSSTSKKKKNKKQTNKYNQKAMLGGTRIEAVNTDS